MPTYLPTLVKNFFIHFILVIRLTFIQANSASTQCYKPVKSDSGKNICVIAGNMSRIAPLKGMCEIECAYRCRSYSSSCIGFNCRYVDSLLSCELVHGEGGDWKDRYVDSDSSVAGCCRFYSVGTRMAYDNLSASYRQYSKQVIA
ncbi:hypothetical protein HELRODRAFT_183547 [Helobdella robusta]|uniref:Apple domain-containing protein n=1 Tax=Helobdella robusta TaxID=6412 RepID=T1FJT9_HELRO|nr:hypothetical protein HELRODRAFT_183547 [Helobdella robusta]ESO10517.1 hypothetical protein HELRODRAFT_183547 [Helobdella robusta]